MGIADSRKRLGGRRGRRAHLDNPSRPEADPAAIAQERQERKQADEQRRREERSAQLIAEAIRRRDSSRGIDHTIRLRNVGPAAARDVYVWLALLLAGDEVSAPASYQTHVGSVVPDDEWIAFTVTQGPRGRRNRAPGGHPRLMARPQRPAPRSRDWPNWRPAVKRAGRGLGTDARPPWSDPRGRSLSRSWTGLGGGASRRRR